MSTSRKIAEWSFSRPGNLPDLKATVFLTSPQANSEHENPFTFHAQIEGKKGITGAFENINDLSRLLQVTANPKAALDWKPIYFVGIRHHRSAEQAQVHEEDEPGNYRRRNISAASLDISYRSGWLATMGKTRYFCDRDPRVAMNLRYYEITTDVADVLGHPFHASTIQIYPGTPATRDALDSLVAKLESLSKSLDALNQSEDLTRLAGLLPLPEK